MPRPSRAAQTRCPNPLVAASRTFSPRFKSVPARPAAVVEKLGRVAVGAEPAALRGRLPAAMRAANLRKIGFLVLPFDQFENLVGFRSSAVSRKNGFEPQHSAQDYHFLINVRLHLHKICH